MLFTIKKIVGTLLMPLPLGFALLLVGLVLYRYGRKKLALGLLGLVLACWWALSTPIVSILLTAPLEAEYQAYDGEAVDFVVVLGGYHASDEQIPISSLLSATSLTRLMEGISVLQRNPGARLLLSGYAADDELSHAEALARVAAHFGVPREIMQLQEAPRDTVSEARAWSALLRGQRFALVTSATHMPRAMRLFELQGLSPVAAPTNFVAAGSLKYSWRNWMPRGYSLYRTEQAWHEYLGLLWIKIKS